ncbi:MAG: T9SS type A sorting domain-containing protein [bacterium]
MKTLILKFFCATIFFLSSSNSFSQLNGTYTIGSGGNFATINSAVSALYSQGVGGPVIFDILTGIYNENVMINGIIPGYTAINITTFKSQAGNTDSVSVRSFNIRAGAAYLNIIKLKITNSISLHTCSYIGISDNDFNNSSISYMAFGAPCNHITVNRNRNVGGVTFDDVDWGIFLNTIRITNNFITTMIIRSVNRTVLIENNTISDLYIHLCKDVIISKNKFSDGFNVTSCDTINIINNLINAPCDSLRSNYLQFNDHINIFFNTFKNNCLNDEALVFFNRNATTINNLFINFSGGFAFSAEDLSNLNVLSDYNNFYNGTDSNLINYSNTIFNNVNDFYNSTGFDEHSNSRVVNFVSETDLHLAGSSIGDIQLAGIPTSLVTDDIDGQPRNPFHPYKGADEPDVPLPVELTSFTSSVINNNVQLRWTTISEINNFGFDVERSSVNDLWSKIGFVKGNGNSNSLNNYFYEDKNVSSGKYKYRLKQTDYNGNFEYHNLLTEVIVGVPIEFKLSQNYPNPFNPVTIINYSVPRTQFITIKVYDMTGKEILTLVNETKEAGSYSIEFEGSNLPSGMYFYKIKAGAFNDVRMMVLLK